jgi:glucose-1-phosphate thymidylyltransferase
MKGVILAGGTGSRLYPLTKVTNKHLLPVGLKPMIYYPIEKLTEAGIRQILIVTGTEHMGSVVSLLGSGRDFGCHFTYKVQDEAGGIAQALGLSEDFAQEGPLAVILGDNLFEDSLVPMVQRFREDQQERGARIALKEVPDPHRFGVATLEGDRVVKIVEKPKQPESHWAVTGVYLYDGRVFEAIHTLKPSGRGELEITDVNNAYIAGGKMGYDVLKGWWSDAGTFESLARANHFVLGEGA